MERGYVRRSYSSETIKANLGGDVLFKEMLSLGWVGENGSLDLPESSFSTL
jgi:hypothetical protein